MANFGGPVSGNTYIDGTGLDLTGNIFSVAPGGIGPTELADTAVTPGVYGTATAIPVLTIDDDGRITLVTTIPPTAANVDGTSIDVDGSSNLRRMALTGDIAATAGSSATTLATVNSNVGTFGSAANSAQVTVNAKGLATAASDVPIQIAESQVTNLVADLAATSQYTPQRPTAGFTIPTNTQILFGIDIDLQAANGDLTVNGILQGVR